SITHFALHHTRHPRHLHPFPTRRSSDLGARKVQRKYLPLMDVNFVESNPIPVKAAMGLMGLLEPVYRLPMCPPKPESLAKIGTVDRKSTRLNSSHVSISYAVFCLKKKKI